VSYCVNAIAVDLDEVRAALGSKKKALLAKLQKELAGGLEQIDDMLQDHIENDTDEDGNPPEPLTTADILRQLVMGEPYRKEFGFAYAYCFEALCEHFGESLNNGEWSAMRSEWFETVRRELKKAGVNEEGFSMNKLFFRGPPVKLPEIEDFPNVGYLTKSEVAQARAALAKADLSKVKNKEAVAAIEQIRSWLDECAKSDRDLVCTYA
jgi:hypothetical protein